MHIQKSTRKFLLSALFVSTALLGISQTSIFNYTGAQQTYTVPAGVTSISIQAKGAQGGNSSVASGGLGANMKGNFAVTPGQVLKVLVGGQPVSNLAAGNGGGGGGGSFVVTQLNSPLVIAGGGGGAAGQCCGIVNNGVSAVITTNGTAGLNQSGFTGAGGINGNGGGAATQGQNSGAGGGLLTDGANGAGGSGGGKSFLNGGIPGTPAYQNPGGFGGGGGTHYGAGGGGGGYSGGGATAGGGQWGGGGGGGSINNGTSQVNSAGSVTGNGSVTITVLTIPATGLNFDGVNDYVSLNNSIGNVGSGDFTIEMNIRTTLANTYFFSKRSVCGDDNFISMQTLDGKLSVELDQGNGAVQYLSLTGLTLINDNVWHHIAMTRKSGLVKIYVDEFEQASGTSTANINNVWTATLGLSSCTNQNGSVYFSGDMDEVRFWSRAVCQSELIANKGCSLNPAGQIGLTALYRFDQGAVNNNNTGINTLTDAAGSNSGTLQNFSLTGASSNWVLGNTIGTCSYVPTTAPITGTTAVCYGDGSTLSNAISGGVWTSSNSSIASVNASTGVVSTFAPGTVNISYTNECGGVSTIPFTVYADNTITLTSALGTESQVVCLNKPSTNITYSLSGPAGVSYAYTLSQFGALNVASVGNTITISGMSPVAGTHTYNLFTSGGCGVAYASGTITVNPLPAATITASGSTNICAGSSVTLTASVGSSYLWSNGAITQAITTSVAGSYTVTVTNASGCSASSSATVVTVNPLPTATITSSGPTTFCAGGSVLLSTDAALSFAGASADDKVEIAANPALDFSTGTLECWIKPNASLDNKGFLAMRNTVSNLRWSAHINENFNTIGIWNGSAFNTVTAPFDIVAGTWYHVALVMTTSNTQVYLNGAFIGNINVGINTANTGLPLTIGCMNDAGYPQEKFAGQMDEVRIWNTARTASEILNNYTANISPASSGLVAYYKLNEGSGSTATNATGAGLNGTLINNPLRVASTIPSVGSLSYLWSPGNQTTPTITASASGTYTVTAVNASGCSATSAGTVVTVNATPTVNAVANQEVCHNATPTTAIAFSGSVSGTVYNWTNNNTTIGLGASGTGDIPSFLGINTSNTPAIATITVTPVANGCSGTPITFTIRVNPIPTFNAIPNQTVCAGYQAGGVIFVGNVPGTTYSWSGGAAIGLANGSGAILPSFNTPGSITTQTIATILVVSNVPGESISCGTSRSFTITVNPIPIASITVTGGIYGGFGPYRICPGGSLQMTLTAGAGFTYQWRKDGVDIPGATNISYSASESGTYFAVITSNGCSFASLGNIPVLVQDVYPPNFTTPYSILTPNVAGTVTATGPSGAVVNYVLPNAQDNCGGPVSITGTPASGSVFPIGTTTVTVVASDAAGNSSTTSFNVTVSGLAPVINCPSNITVNNTLGQCGANVSFAATETTGVPASVITYSVPTGTFFNIGTHTVTATATNAIGTSSCSFTITVVDNQLPTVICQNITVPLDANGQAVITAAQINNGSSDNCGIASIAISKTNFDCSNVVVSSVSNFALFTSTGSFVVPNGATNVRVLAIGGGGGGANGHQGGGGSGYVQTASVSVTPGQTIPITVGAGGNGALLQTNNNIVGLTAGQSSSFGSFLTANGGGIALGQNAKAGNGGSGGGGSCNGGSLGGAGGSGGNNGGSCTYLGGTGQGSYIASLAQFVNNSITAGAGGAGGTSSHAGGGGAGGLLINGTGINGSNGTQSFSGKGGKGYGAAGGAGGYEGSLGANRWAGGNGASGLVYVEWDNPLGVPVTLTVTDNNGNTASCTAYVTVVDNIAPTITTCPAPLTVECAADVPAPNIASVIASDNCSATVSFVSDVISNQTCANRYTITRTYKATDISGNATNCTQIITVNDNTAPVIVCPSTITINAALGTCSAIATYVATATDNCSGAVSISYSIPSGTTFNVGTTAVTVTATDICGNSSTCTFNVIVVDNQAPTFTSSLNILTPNIAGVVTATGSDGAVVNYALPNATDNCSGSVIVTGTPVSGSVFPIGTTTVTVLATDNAGNISSNTYSITVSGLAPNINCPANIVVNSTAGLCGANVSFVATETTGIPASVITYSIPSGSFFAVGTHTVTATATNAVGSSSCTFTVTVKDVLAPVINAVNFNVPANILTNVPEAAQYQLVYKLPIPNSADWNTGSTIPYTVNNAAALASTPFGRIAYYMELDNKWVWVSMDKFTNNVALTGIPTGSTIFQQNVNNLNVLSSSGAGVTNGNSIATGNIEFWSNCYTQVNANAVPGASGSTYDFGDQTVSVDCYGSFQVHNYGAAQTIFAYNRWSNTGNSDLGIGNNTGNVNPDWTFMVNAANYGNKNIYVFITGGLQNITANTDAGQCSALVNITPPSATDDCGTPTVTGVRSDNLALSAAYPIGVTTITWTATDASSNTTTATQTVTVVDNIAPVITCSANISVPTASNKCAATINIVNATAVDNCGAVTVTGVRSDALALSADYPIGTTTITWTATDASGNVSTCTQTIIITDNVLPTVITQNISVTLNASGNASITASQIDNGSTDNCGVASLAVSPNTFNCSNVSSVPNAGNAMFFNGGSLDVAHEASIAPLNTWTIETWVKTSVAGVQHSLIEKYSCNGSEYGYLLRITGSNQLMAYALTGCGGGNVTGTSTLAANTWYHVAATFNRTTGTLKVYVNGVLDGTATGITTPTSPSTLPLRIGSRGNDAGTRLQGWLDDVRIWDVERSAAQILAAKGTKLSGTETGLQAYYPFDETIANASVIDGATLTLANNSTVTSGVSRVVSNAPIASLGTAVVLTVTDVNGNSATGNAIVTVIDNISPVFTTCAANQSLIATSASGATVTYTLPTATDNCSAVVTRTAGFASGATFPIGTTTVTHTATDPSGNTVSCSFTVTVSGLAPVIVCPANIVVNAPFNQCGTNVNFAATETTGIPASTITYSIAPNSFFNVGTTTVTATATNAVGSSSCTFTVQVKDVTPPVLACAGGVSGPAVNLMRGTSTGGTASVVGWAGINGATQYAGSSIGTTCNEVWRPFGTLCDEAPNTNSQTISTKSNPNSGITWNSAGGTGTGVMVVDLGLVASFNMAQVYQMFSDGKTTSIQGFYHNNTSNIAPLYNDAGWLPLFPETAVGPGVLSGNNVSSPTSVNFTTTSARYVRFYAKNSGIYGGNTWIETRSIKLFNTAPSVDKDVTTDPGACSAVVTYNVAATDNCSGTTVSYSIPSGSVFPIGTTQVTVTATDASANTSTCTFNVTVSDKEKPTITTPSNIFVNNDPGVCGATVTLVVPATADNCGVASVTNNAPSLFSIGATTVTWTVTDIHGNTQTATQIVTVTDNQAPTFVSGGVIITPTNLQGEVIATSAAGAIVQYAAPVGTDNCPGANTVLTSGLTSGSLFSIGTHTVTYTVTDAAGLQATSTFTIIVSGLAPVINCPPNIVVTASAGQCGTNVTYAATETTAIPASTITYSIAPGSFFNVGTTAVVATATNAVGTVSCTFNVTVTDNESPTITTANQTQTADAGLCSALVTVAAPVTGDNCGVQTVTNSINGTSNASGVYPVGTTTIIWTITDIHNNSSTTTQTITVTDNELPTITTANQTQTADAGLCTALVTVAAPVTGDNCGVQTITNSINGTSNASGVYPVGTTTIIWTVTDVHNNSSTTTQTITVTDNELPTITTVNQTQTADAGLCSALVTVAAPVTGDNCGVQTVTNSINGTSNASGVYPVGTTTIIWTVTDVHNNSSTTTQTITVTDNELPTITTVNQTQTADAGLCTALVTVAAPVTGDNCGVQTVTNSINGTSNASGVYPVGTTTIIWTVTDIHNNSSTTTQTITVTDNELPTITTVNQTQTADAGLCTALVTVAAPVTGDNCGVQTVTNSINGNSNASGVYPVGTTTIIWTVTDVHNNSSTTTQTITVTDNELPTITTINQTQTADAGLCTALVTVAAPVTGDNCGVQTVTNSINGTSNASGVYPVGTTTIIWTVTDVHNNSSTTTQTITVTDNELPTITTVNQTQTADAGSCSALVTVAAPVTGDNCGIQTLTNSINGTSDASGVYPVGTTTITWTVVDIHSNTQTTTQIITVTDNELPVITTNGNKTQSSDAGICAAAVVVSAVAADNCGVGNPTGVRSDELALSDLYPVGTTTITWTVTDIHGNTGTVTQTVTVTDNELPVVVTQNITIQLDALGNASITPAQINNGSSDNCAIASYVLSKTTFDCSNVGNNTVTLTVTDIHGNVSTATAVVTVQDLVAPVVITQNITVDLDQTGHVSITAAQVNNGSSDACGIATMTVSPSSFDCSQQGPNTVTLTVTDVNGNVSTATAIVTVQDKLGPVPTLVSLPTVVGQCYAGVKIITDEDDDDDHDGHHDGDDDDGDHHGDDDDDNDYRSRSHSTSDNDDDHGDRDDDDGDHHDGDDDDDHGPTNVLHMYTPTALDNCSGLITATTTDPLMYYVQGTYIIHWKFVDAQGNITIQEQTVVVDDTQAPVPHKSSLKTITGECSVTVGSNGNGHDGDDDDDYSNSAPWAKDNCKGWIRGTTTDPLTYTAQGTYTIHWTYNDGNGNISTQNQTVIVKDVTAPKAVVSSLPTLKGSCSVTVTTIPTAKDNCVGIVSATTVSPLTYTAQGKYTIVWTYTDGRGNTSTQTQKVEVEDNTKPVISDVADINVNCGSSTAPSATGTPVATDNCGTVVLTYSDKVSGNKITRTWKATDAAGNYSTSEQTITIPTPFNATVSSVPTSSTYTGGVSTNLYIGYGAQSTALTVCALPSSGAPYTYAWTGGSVSKLSSTTSSAPVFTPGATGTGSHAFTVTITNKFGCTATANITICVTDIIVAGTGGSKVYICHKPKGKNAVPQTMQVLVSQVASHINNNSCGSNGTDRLGTCGQTPCAGPVATASPIVSASTGMAKDGEIAQVATTEEELKVTVMPNPTTTYFTLKLESKYQTPVEMRVMDGLGRVVDARSKLGSNSTLQIGHSYSSGTYYAELIQGTKRKVVQLIKVRG